TLVLVLTGGTSTIAKEVALRSNKPTAILAHGEDNSLPSSIEAREKLRSKGIYAKLIYLDYEQLELNEKLNAFAKIAKAYNYLRNFKIIGIETNIERYVNIGDLKIEVVNISDQELSNALNSVSDNEISQLEEKLAKWTEVIDVSTDDLKNSIKLYLATSKILEKYGAKAVTFNCFKFILKHKITPCLTLSLLNSRGFLGVCEAEIPAAIAMAIGKAISEKPTFMGNFSAFNTMKNTITLAHCTAPLNVAKGKSRLVKHFETELSVSLDVPIEEAHVALITLSRDLNQVMVVEGKVVQSSMGNPSMCRTQIEIKIDMPVDKFVEKTLGNHQIMVFGKMAKVINELAQTLKIEVVNP
ncbi:MAG: hypothetical protein DRJ26_01965, partial [Candidatus Methanomethylicota archaeon]